MRAATRRAWRPVRDLRRAEMREAALNQNNHGFCTPGNFKTVCKTFSPIGAGNCGIRVVLPRTESAVRKTLSNSVKATLTNETPSRHTDQSKHWSTGDVLL